MASTLKINTLTGVTTAGSIAVTGEGNSTTTNLQQGLCKVWVNMDAGQNANNSLNVTSLTDVDTGAHTINYTNNMANVRPIPQMLPKEDTDETHTDIPDRIANPARMPYTTSELKVVTINLSSQRVDLTETTVTVHGDLA